MMQTHTQPRQYGNMDAPAPGGHHVTPPERPPKLPVPTRPPKPSSYNVNNMLGNGEEEPPVVPPRRRNHTPFIGDQPVTATAGVDPATGRPLMRPTKPRVANGGVEIPKPAAVEDDDDDDITPTGSPTSTNTSYLRKDSSPSPVRVGIMFDRSVISIFSSMIDC